MSWNDGYYDERPSERDHAFEITCSSCGALRLNTDGDYCSCGSSSMSYDGADAARWNDHTRGGAA